MNNELTFMSAVEIPAPDDQMILWDLPILKEKPPLDLGGASVVLVAAVQTRHESTAEAPSYQPTSINTELSISHAIRIKSAEYWLKLGKTIQAVLELEKLPKSVRNHPWALKVHVAALGSVREINCQAHAE